MFGEISRAYGLPAHACDFGKWEQNQNSWALLCPQWALSLSPLQFHCTWVGGYTCCSPALVTEGGSKAPLAVHCVAACPLAQVLYSPRALLPRRPAGMSLPFPSHIWVSGTRVPPSAGPQPGLLPWSPVLTKEGAAWPRWHRPGHIWSVSPASQPLPTARSPA